MTENDKIPEDNVYNTNESQKDPEKNSGQPQEDFGIGADVTGKNAASFTAGFNRADLVGVVAREIGKGDSKYFVLDFKFVDPDRVKSFTHREFIPKGKSNTKQTEKENYDDRKMRFNTRIKHIWEEYAQFPSEPLGKGALSWNQLFTMVANSFNTSNNGGPIYMRKEGDKSFTIPVWLKNTYDNDNNIQLPMFPNFIERITPETNASNKPKVLQINLKFDKMEQTKKLDNTTSSGNLMGGVVGGIGSTSSGTDMGF